jgi:glutathione S-transferase
MAILHQMQLSGNCYKIRLAARQIGFPLQLKEYPLLDGETRRPEYLAKNPNGRVPLLEFDDGRCLAESDAILWHISEGTSLQPSDAWGRAEALQWMFFEQYSHEPNIARARFWLNFAPKEALETRRALVPGWLEEGNAALGVMNAHLTQHEWFAGERYSVADIALYGYTHCADEGGFDLGRYPAVARWITRVQALPGHIAMSVSW